MRMTINESIDVLKEHLRILNVDKGIEFWKEIEALEMALDTMHKYQEIKKIYMTHHYTDEEVIEKIKEVIKWG